MHFCLPSNGMRNEGKSTSLIRKTRASLSTLFATALEGLISTNPIRGVRIPAPLVEETPDEDRAKALTRAKLATLLSAIPADWHLFFEFLVHTGLRISEMIGLTWEHMELETNSHVKVREQFYRCQRGKVADRVLNPTWALVGMPWVSFHTFRHTCASFLFANGKDIKQIQVWLGHADAPYPTHLCPPTGRCVGSADFLDDAIEVGRGPWSEGP